MKYTSLLLIITIVFLSAQGSNVQTIDFLKRYDLEYNGAGPLFVKVDTQRNRIIVPHTLSSAVSIIEGSTHRVTNIPLQSRIPQHFKEEALLLCRQTGMVYVIGENCLHVIDPQMKKARAYYTDQQYEMAAVDADTRKVFLAGRSSKHILMINLGDGRQVKIPWTDYSEPLVNLNQTPPPPIRKVLIDQKLSKLIALDGFTAKISFYNVENLRKTGEKNLTVENGSRWHMAGYNTETHCLFVVMETGKRKVTHAIRINVSTGDELVISLPGFTEAVGVTYNPNLDEVYIPYDNHPAVHVVDFKDNGQLSEIKLPLYGNDASAIDLQNDLLYIASWAFGEIEIIDLKTRKFIDRIPDLEIIPHMFTMDFNPNTEMLYFPKGATAVNGAFGAAITAVDVNKQTIQKIYTGWAPVDLIQRSEKEEYFIFNSDDEYAIANPDGSVGYHKLPFEYPHQVIYAGDSNIYVSYGPHQSYWPTVYIWGARNGIGYLDQNTLKIRDRRIPRLAQQICTDKNGIMYALQNSWGAEQQFITVLKDEVREFDARQRIVLPDTVNRETIQRILKYDEILNRLYLVKTGEMDTDPGKLHVIDLDNNKQIAEIPTLLTPTDLIFDNQFIYICHFDSDSIIQVEKESIYINYIHAGHQQLKLCRANDQIFVLNHGDRTIQQIWPQEKTHHIPVSGQPDGLFVQRNNIYIASHSNERLFIDRFNTIQKSFIRILDYKYPYGSTTFNTNNSSFYLRGQFGDRIYDLTKFKEDESGRIWITDFLSGKAFIVTTK